MSLDEPARPFGRGAYTIREFCARHGFSRSLFYKLKRSGKAPRLKYVGVKPIITAEAEAEWRRESEAEAA
jgi:hypothetical protein